MSLDHSSMLAKHGWYLCPGPLDHWTTGPQDQAAGLDTDAQLMTVGLLSFVSAWETSRHLRHTAASILSAWASCRWWDSERPRGVVLTVHRMYRHTQTPSSLSPCLLLSTERTGTRTPLSLSQVDIQACCYGNEGQDDTSLFIVPVGSKVTLCTVDSSVFSLPPAHTHTQAHQHINAHKDRASVFRNYSDPFTFSMDNFTFFSYQCTHNAP